MTRKSTIVFILIAIISATPLFAHGNLKFVNGRWFDGTRFVERTVYSVEKTFQSEFDGPLQETIDLHGAWVIPPFADAHNHLLSDPSKLLEQMRRFQRAGIFYVKNPNNLGQFTTELRSRLETPETLDVIYANGGLTASGGHPIQLFAGATDASGRHVDLAGNAYFVVDTPADFDRQWPAILQGKPDFIKLYLEHSEEYAKRRDDPAFYGRRGLDPALLAPITERAHAAGLTTTVHIATAADFHNALIARVDEITHLPLERIDAADAELAARQKTVVVTTTLSHRPSEGADLAAVHRANLELLKKAGVRVVIGVDHPERTAIDEILNVASLGVYSPLELLTMATSDTARSIFPARKLGALADGYEASFVALESNPLEDLTAIRKVVMRVKQGHVLNVPPEKPGVSDALLPMLEQKGARKTLGEYERLRHEKSDVYDFGEAQLNRVGYALLRKEDAKGAILFFERNTQLFPESSNVWDSLGEGYMHAGRRADAVASYRKSLALNPHNQNAVEFLRKLESQKP